MANRTINTNQLTPGTTFMVRGKVTWSHIASLIQGKELEERIARERQAGRMGIIDRPHSTISIHEARVVYKNPQAEQNPQLRRIEENYANETMFASSKHSGMNFTGVNRTTRLPWVGTIAPGTTEVQAMQALDAELAREMDVTLVMRVYKGGTGKNNGVNLDGIILNEPIRYFQSVNLSDYGLTFKPAEPAAPAAAPAGEEEPNPYAANTPPAGPFDSQPAAQAPVGAPPVAEPMTPVQPAQPAQSSPAAPAQGQGIRYDPSADPTRQY